MYSLNIGNEIYSQEPQVKQVARSGLAASFCCRQVSEKLLFTGVNRCAAKFSKAVNLGFLD